MLQHVDSFQVFRELVSLRALCNPAQNPAALGAALRLASKRLRALLPEDLDLAEGPSPVALDRLRYYLDLWDALSNGAGEVQPSAGLFAEVQSLTNDFRPLPSEGPVEGADSKPAAVALTETKAKNAKSVPSTAVEALLGDESKEVLEIAKSDKTVDSKMRAICGIDRQFIPRNSGYWSKLLGVSAASIRKTSFWKVDRAKAIEAQQQFEADRAL